MDIHVQLCNTFKKQYWCIASFILKAPAMKGTCGTKAEFRSGKAVAVVDQNFSKTSVG